MESLLFISLILIGTLFLLISLITLIVGLAKKSSKLKKTALGIGVVPIFCFGLIFFWYLIVIPSFNETEMEEFAGTYVLNDSIQNLSNENNGQTTLILLSNGTYKFDGIKNFGLEKNGNWRTGGVDRMFEFDVQNGSKYATPSDSGDRLSLSFEYQMRNDKNDSKNIKEIIFIKK